MFKCCLCGKEYELEKDVVKCVNRCGRQKASEGVFQSKNSKYSGEFSTTDFGFEVEDIVSKEKISEMLDDLIKAGAPHPYIDGIINEIERTWDNKSNQERMDDYNRIMLIKGIYKMHKR